jgi:lipase ATG15
MLPATLTTLLVPLLNLLTDTLVPSPPQSLRFELRHLHAVSPSAHVIFSDVPARPAHIDSEHGNHTHTSYFLQTRPITSFRPPSFSAYAQARTRSIRYGQSEDIAWEEDEMQGPDVESRETLLELAKMTHNAYIDPNDPAWYELDGNWTIVSVI